MSIDFEFLKQACSEPWKAICIGGIERTPEDNSFNANHVYVDCLTPFLLAAESLESPGGEEFFSVASTSDLELIQAFLRGPYPPHNQPPTLSLERAIDGTVDGFLIEPKKLDVSRKTVKFMSEDASLVPVVLEVVISAHSGKLVVCADDSIPMALKVNWVSNSANQRGRR